MSSWQSYVIFKMISDTESYRVVLGLHKWVKGWIDVRQSIFSWWHLLVLTILYSSHCLSMEPYCSSNVHPAFENVYTNSPWSNFHWISHYGCANRHYREWIQVWITAAIFRLAADPLWGQQLPKVICPPKEGAPLFHGEQAGHSSGLTKQESSTENFSLLKHS